MTAEQTPKRSRRLVLILPALAVVAIVAAVVIGPSRPRNATPKPELVLFCAAGIQPPVDQIVSDYEQQKGVAVRVQYGGSGQLLSNIEAAKRGDLFLAAEESYIKQGREKKLVAESIAVASQRPVIVARAGNPLHIASLEDLLRPDVKVALANPDQAAIGRAIRRLLTPTKQWAALEKHAAVLKPTVNDLANDVKLGAADAAIIWDTTAATFPDLAVVHVPILDRYVERVVIGVLTSSANPTEAIRFARFLTASDKGLPVFQKHGFTPVDGDVWEAKPTLTFYAGALNRVAVQETIARFEQREGCRINTIYNGCGILVAGMKAGERPDAYLACDLSFVPPVADLFHQPIPISECNIVIAYPKGNPKKIVTAEDLARPGLKIGICNAEQSAIGALTKKLWTPTGLYEKIAPNVRTTSATADTLINQTTLGSLDASVVCTASVASVRDKLDFLPVSGGTAIQPFAIGKTSTHQQLAGRLLETITSPASRQVYESLGFTWKASSAGSNKQGEH